MSDLSLNKQQLDTLIENLKIHLVAHGIEESSAGCIACKAGLGASIGAAVVTCIAATEGACVGAIAEATGLSEAAVTAILAGGGSGVQHVLQELCHAMKAC